MAKILIVDDEKIMLRIATKILSKEHEIICAGSGAEAIEIFQREKPDLILSDLIMPEIDGYELHRILQEKSSEPIPIIFMTADESDESESKGFEIGAADYIRKPLKSEVLLRRVKNVLDKIDKIQGLTEAANLDLMTGLLNKTAAQREIAKLCATGQGVLALLDLDNFKLVNDFYGHAMGDKILIQFAELIRGVIRSTDLAGRIGGDEFLIFCQNIRDDKIIFNKALFLNHQLIISAKNFMGEDMNIPLGTSVGAVLVPDEGRDFATLMEKADKALYKVKYHGKHGCAFFGEADSSESTEHKNISQTQMILSERNHEAGAYFIDFEKFKAVYRFEARLNDNLHMPINFWELTLETDNDEAREDFLEILIKNLRRSDCVTQYGRDQFLIILNDTPSEKIESVREKILTAWKAKKLGGEIIFESGKIF
ncbi:MAG: diguanylate cyclase [Selenomonadaceae bacterium]|nr:diguanylate cyclase [Selenomonadaceae bacterium]